MSKRRHILVAGFDFGTRFSKVILRDQNTQVTKVVTFPSKFPALYPSCICLKDGRMLPPEQRTEDGQMLHYLKMIAGHCWAGKDIRTGGFSVPKEFEELALHLGASEAATIVVSYYFARVITGIRTFIESDEDWSDFDFSQNSQSDVWAVQVCVPAGLIEWDPDVEERFQHALFLGWEFHSQLLANDKSGTSIKVWASQCLHRLRTGFSDTERNALKKICVTYPEVAAGVQSILRSRNARDGRYITMDVGAGTIDLNIFFRASGQELGSRENAKNLNYYSARVEPLGADHIQEDIGMIHAETISKPNGLSPRSRKQIMHDVKGTVDEVFRSALQYQPNFGAGEGTRTWDRNTFVYLWGGGARAKGYRTTLENALHSLGMAEPEVRALENPDGLDLPSSIDFGRMAVAYGLSHYMPNLESVRLPKQLRTFREAYPDLAPEPRNGSSAISSRTCSCGGLNPSCSLCQGRGWIENDPFRRLPVPQEHARREPGTRGSRRIAQPINAPSATSEDRQRIGVIVRKYFRMGDQLTFEEICKLYLELLDKAEAFRNQGVVTLPPEYREGLKVFSRESDRLWKVGVIAEAVNESSGTERFTRHYLESPSGSPLRRINLLTCHKTLREIFESVPAKSVLRMKGTLVFKKAIPRRGRTPGKTEAILFQIKNPKDFTVDSK